MTWALNIVGQENPETLQRLIGDILDVVGKTDHVLVKAQLSTDAGTVELELKHYEPPPDAAPVQTPVEES